MLCIQNLNILQKRVSSIRKEPFLPEPLPIHDSFSNFQNESISFTKQELFGYKIIEFQILPWTEYKNKLEIKLSKIILLPDEKKEYVQSAQIYHFNIKIEEIIISPNQ